MSKQATQTQTNTDTVKALRVTRPLDQQIADAKTKAQAALVRVKELESKHLNSRSHKNEIANNINRKLIAVVADIKVQSDKLNAIVRKDSPVLWAAQYARIANLNVKRLELKQALKNSGGKVTKIEKVEKELSMTNLVKLSVGHGMDSITY